MRDAKRAWGKPRTCAAPERRNFPRRPRPRVRAVPAGQLRFSSACGLADAAPSGGAAWGYFCSAFHAGTWGRRHSCLRSRGGRAPGDEHPPRGVPAIAHLQCALFFVRSRRVKTLRWAIPPRRGVDFPSPGRARRGSESNPLKSPKSLFVFARPAPKTWTSSPPNAHKKRSREISPRERLSLSSKP